MALFRRSEVLVVFVGWASACTAIVAPEDEVQRCGSAEDCEAIDDHRYVAECRFPEGSEFDGSRTDKVCVAAYRRPSCAPSRLGELYEELRRDRSRFVACETFDLAPRGCPARTGVCAEGLVARADGICDLESNPAEPAYPIAYEDLDPAQDLLDAACQSFFCDERFVCDHNATCVPCDEGAPYGRGGCGRIFSAGEPSCLYSPLGDACDGPEAQLADPALGECT